LIRPPGYGLGSNEKVGIVRVLPPGRESDQRAAKSPKGRVIMHKSVDHILITHTGSLPRGQELNDLLIADEAGESVDQRKLAEMIDTRVAYVMEKQREAGVDVANDGEQGRVGFQTYVPKPDMRFGT
jgi:hypothetical protein